MKVTYTLYGVGMKAKAVRTMQMNGQFFLAFASHTFNEPAAEVVRKYGVGETSRLVLTMGRGQRDYEEADRSKAQARLDAWKRRNAQNAMQLLGSCQSQL